MIWLWSRTELGPGYYSSDFLSGGAHTGSFQFPTPDHKWSGLWLKPKGSLLGVPFGLIFRVPSTPLAMSLEVQLWATYRELITNRSIRTDSFHFPTPGKEAIHSLISAINVGTPWSLHIQHGSTCPIYFCGIQVIVDPIIKAHLLFREMDWGEGGRWLHRKTGWLNSTDPRTCAGICLISLKNRVYS